jgi:hypothetical protein
MAVPTLSTNRYLFIGTYIGQYISPKSVQLTSDVRLPTAFGVGHRLASVYNIEILRSFVTAEPLTFTTLAPFLATLQHPSSGSQAPPVSLYKATGEVVRPDQYQFLPTVPNGPINQVLIRTANFDHTASYFINYQSTDRTVNDTLPVNDLREIRSLGDQVNQEKYREYTDFYVPMLFPSSITPNPTNVNPTSSVEVPNAALANTGSGVITQNVASQFNHNYTRFYSLSCVAASGVSPNRTATFHWSATPISGGNFAYPPNPLFSSAPPNSITINEAVPTSLSEVIELGIKLDMAFGVSNFVVGDVFTFNGLGPALFEVDVRHTNTNEIISYGTITGAVGNTGTGAINHDPLTNYNGDANIGYNLICIAASGVTPNRTATFAWSSYREIGASGSFVVNENAPSSLAVTLSQGVIVDFGFGIANFSVNDQFAFLIDVPFKFVYFKDDRTYTLQIGAATNPTGTSGFVSGTYSVNTPEGGFGLFQASADITGATNGRFDLPDNLRLIARNLIRGNTPEINQHHVGDSHTFTTSLSDVINFALTLPQTDERDPAAGDQILLDVTGAITGTSNTYYSILSFLPLLNFPLTATVGGNPVQVTPIPGTPYMSYAAGLPTGVVVINYRQRGQEPDPGAVYYFTANYLRPVDFYNKLYVVSSLEEGRRLLGPPSSTNMLYIANELAWDQPVNLVAAGFVQVMDADSDGIYTVTDFRTTIQSVQTSSLITDKTVLNMYAAWPDALADNIKLSDPFQAKEHLWWFGAPINTPVGDNNTPDSLVYLSQVTLQVYGDSPAHGTRILCAPTYGDVQYNLQDGTSITTRVDGSLFAFAQACKSAGFTSTSDSILLTQTDGFSALHIHSESDQLLLGAANIVFPVDVGAGVYENYEDVTVDTFAPDFANINAMIQKQDVTRAVRTAMNTALIKLKITSGEAAIGIITGVLVRILQGLQVEGRIASYQDASGNIRPLDPASDIRVYRDQDNPTQFSFFYNYFITYILKRLLGLYTVDTAALALPPSGNATNT